MFDTLNEIYIKAKKTTSKLKSAALIGAASSGALAVGITSYKMGFITTVSAVKVASSALTIAISTPVLVPALAGGILVFAVLYTSTLVKSRDDSTEGPINYDELLIAIKENFDDKDPDAPKFLDIWSYSNEYLQAVSKEIADQKTRQSNFVLNSVKLKIKSIQDFQKLTQAGLSLINIVSLEVYDSMFGDDHG